MATQNKDALTTPSKVRDISGSELPDSSLYAFINTAHVMVKRLLPDSHGYDDDTLLMMETWLACHLLTAREPLITTERIGSTYISYMRNQNTLGLDASPYGQFLKMLDPRGWLAEAEKGRIIFEVLSEYDDPEYYASYI